MTSVAALVLVLGTAAGLDLFLTLVFLGAFAGLGPDPGQPGFSALAFPLLVIPAVALWLLEWRAERMEGFGFAWRLAQLAVRPVGAATLVLLALPGLPFTWLALAAVVAGTVAGLVQVCRTGWALRTSLEGQDRELGRGLLVEDLLVLALVATLWVLPPVGLGVAATILAWYGIRAPGLLRAHRLAVALVSAHVRRLAKVGRWLAPTDFPDWMKARLAPSGVVTGGRLRAARAACLGFPGPRSLRFGWLVVRGPEPVFAFRARHGVESRPISLRSPTLTTGPFCVSLPVSFPGHADLLLVMAEDGPEPDLLLDELLDSRGSR